MRVSSTTMLLLTTGEQFKVCSASSLPAQVQAIGLSTDLQSFLLPCTGLKKHGASQ